MSQIYGGAACDSPAQPSSAPAADDGKGHDSKCYCSLKTIFKKCAMCAGSGAGGLLIGHAGCLVTPLVIVASGATATTAGSSLAAMAFGAVATAGGLYAWHKLRGEKAEKAERRLVIGSALTGVLLSSAFHMGVDHQSHAAKDFVPTSWCGKSPPPAMITNQIHH